jgi:hypothetical protein
MGTKLLMKLLLRVVAPAVLVVLLLVALVRLDVLDAPLRSLAEGLGIMSRRTRSTSEVLLEELREVYELNTVEYIYRTVFPYDYMPETTSLADVMQTIRTTSGPVDEVLSEEQRLYFGAYNVAEEVGLGEEEFLVLTVRVFAGFDLEGTPFSAEGGGGGPGENGDAAEGGNPRPALVSGREAARPAYVAVEPLDGGGRRATVRIPPATVTDIVIEDVDPATYRYPDVGMDAEGWRDVAAFVSQHVEARTIEEGILESATANARELVRNLLLSAGIDEVSFAQPSSLNDANNEANSEERR